LLFWQVDEALVVVGDECLDLLDAQGLILRNGQMPDIFGLDLLPGARDEIL